MPKASIVLASKNLKPNTIKTYLSRLSNLNGGVEPTTYKTFEDTAAVDKQLEIYATNSKRTFYIALVAFLPETNKARKYYYSKMMEINKGAFENTEKSQDQKDNWMTQEEVIQVWKDLKEEAEPLLDKSNLSYAETHKLKAFVLLSLFVLQPPRRALDYTAMVVVPQYKEGMDKDFNYLSLNDKTFYFNNYKTAGAYHTQSVPVNPQLFNILKKYKQEGLLLGNNGKPMLGESMRGIFNRMFGKKVSVSMLRNIFLTSKYGGKIDELKNDVKNMATSMTMATNHYIKK
jgi:hypothetical protein